MSDVSVHLPLDDRLHKARRRLQRPIRRLKRRLTWQRRNIYHFSEFHGQVPVDSDASYLTVLNDASVDFHGVRRVYKVTPGCQWMFRRLDGAGRPAVHTTITLTLDAEGSPQLREGGLRCYPATREGWSAMLDYLRREWNDPL